MDRSIWASKIPAARARCIYKAGEALLCFIAWPPRPRAGRLEEGGEGGRRPRSEAAAAIARREVETLNIQD
jgi:hypothetical protein